ncbi:uncharacterized protein BN607_03433 [Bacteroides faecis CAG:32]|nr:uncharacterized protein BN607_03433 [Bacteroides faecis CAG:32]
MPNSSRKTIFTTISIDKETATLVEKICKRYSLKKSEVVKLAFGYIDKAHINPSEAPLALRGKAFGFSVLQEHAVMTPVISIFFTTLIIRYLSTHISIKK